MVRMAQDFSMRYPLVKGQGNFGSVDGILLLRSVILKSNFPQFLIIFADIEKDTCDFVENFDAIP